MRTEEEVMTLIVNVAKTDERIRAVLLVGSRANPNIGKDMFQDFDIVYVVEALETFLNDHTWIDIFGERLIVQMPNEMFGEREKDDSPSFSYLMLFKDRNRIDLTLFPINKLETEFRPDSLTILLLDKDNKFLNVPAPTEIDYLIKRPTQKEFSDCCNEFWWVCSSVAKGLARQEMIPALTMLETPVRKMFLKVIEWYIGIETGFSLPFGKAGKNIQASLPPLLYNQILLTYPGADSGNIWKSLFTMTDVFSELANKISGDLNFEYKTEEEVNVKDYLQWVHSFKK